MALLVKLRELATPPSPPAAPTKLATPGTIFRRRSVLGGGYQPPIRHSQPTQPPASREGSTGAACFGASRRPGAYYRKVSLTFLATASWPELGRSRPIFSLAPGDKRSFPTACRGGAGPAGDPRSSASAPGEARRAGQDL